MRVVVAAFFLDQMVAMGELQVLVVIGEQMRVLRFLLVRRGSGERRPGRLGNGRISEGDRYRGGRGAIRQFSFNSLLQL